MKIPIHELECTYVRSSGPGGQNVNKVNSKCVMRWDVRASESLNPFVKLRFLEQFASKITLQGEILISSDRYRDQKRNFEDCLEKLNEMLTTVLHPPKARKQTKATKGSKRRRLDSKKRDSEKKSMRKRVD